MAKSNYERLLEKQIKQEKDAQRKREREAREDAVSAVCSRCTRMLQNSISPYIDFRKIGAFPRKLPMRA